MPVAIIPIGLYTQDVTTFPSQIHLGFFSFFFFFLSFFHLPLPNVSHSNYSCSVMYFSCSEFCFKPASVLVVPAYTPLRWWRKHSASDRCTGIDPAEVLTGPDWQAIGTVCSRCGRATAVLVFEQGRGIRRDRWRFIRPSVNRCSHLPGPARLLSRNPL